jgi:hypothetical protein
LISAIEPSVSNQLTSVVSVDGNLIILTGLNAVGIASLDNAQGILVRSNTFSTTGFAQPNQALWLHSTSVTVRDNTWNAIVPVIVDITTFISQPTLILPDFADNLLVTGGGSTVELILTSHQADTYGQLTLITVTAPGSGYSRADISISGSGSGASATAIIEGGQIIWIVVTNPGSGYGPVGTTLTVNINGDGAGALATGLVGAPTLSGRRFHCASTMSITFLTPGVTQGLPTWTQSDLVLPAYGSAEIEGVFGNYAITSSPPTGYLTPTNSGNLLIQTITDGDVIVKPDGAGFVQLASDTDPAGISFQIGHGAPENVVIANPGSDYRNLDGGVGSTLWVKQSGTGSQGWVAVA